MARNDRLQALEMVPKGVKQLAGEALSFT